MIEGSPHFVILGHHFMRRPILEVLIIIHHLLGEDITQSPFLHEIGDTGEGLTQGLLMVQEAVVLALEGAGAGAGAGARAGAGAGVGARVLEVTQGNWLGVVCQSVGPCNILV